MPILTFVGFRSLLVNLIKLFMLIGTWLLRPMKKIKDLSVVQNADVIIDSPGALIQGEKVVLGTAQISQHATILENSPGVVIGGTDKSTSVEIGEVLSVQRNNRGVAFQSGPKGRIVLASGSNRSIVIE